jgi:hypothetical protein
MRKLFSISISLFVSIFFSARLSAQVLGNSNSASKKNETFINLSDTVKFKSAEITAEKSEALTYNWEVPAQNTYKIIKNTSGLPLTDQILEEINLHRKFDLDYTWIVNSEIEILIYYVGKPTLISNTDDGK